MNPVEPLPQDWCESVIRILEKGSASHIRWTVRAQMDWSPFGLPYQARGFLARSLRQPAIWGENISGMMPLPGAPKGMKKTIMKTKQVPFDIYIPASEHRAAVKVDTILIDVYTDDFGNEMVTTASTQLIQKTQARYMGLLADSDIRALRERLSLSQDQLSDLLGCGKKSLSRWENGREYPSQLVNTLLRLLEEKKVTPEDLRSVRQPRLKPPPSSSATAHLSESLGSGENMV